jgi:hypothetical protein
VTGLAGLLAQLAVAAASSGPLTVVVVGGETEYRLAGRPFAVTGGGSADFRLRADVAEAARHTPEVAAAARGPEWVRFAPATLDRFARDRATAWFEFARRHAADEPVVPQPRPRWSRTP